VRSETLRAPVTEQRRLRAAYSSSESRMLIMRDRGFRTVILDSEAPEDGGLSLSLTEPGERQF
jgi:hypothetical protein